MDDIVKQAMAKWPNVPSCTGWLGLGMRGDWYMRDATAQQAGDFQCGIAAAKGSKLQHDKLIAFIGRNYQSDARGCWYFQNGPQQVFVELECTPWVLRIGTKGELLTHTGLATTASTALVDEAGRLYLHTALGMGLVHSLDVASAADWLEQHALPLLECASAELPQRYGFVLSPARIAIT